MIPGGYRERKGYEALLGDESCHPSRTFPWPPPPFGTVAAKSRAYTIARSCLSKRYRRLALAGDPGHNPVQLGQLVVLDLDASGLSLPGANANAGAECARQLGLDRKAVHVVGRIGAALMPARKSLGVAN